MKIPKSQSGYSLVEIIIYVAIFAMLAVVVINSVIVVMASFTETRTNRDLQESGYTSLERISREIRQAKSIDVADSTLGGTNPSFGILVLNTTDGSGNARVVKFAVVSGALDIYEGTTFANLALTGNLLNQNINTTSLIFRQITTTVGGAVKVEMTLQDQRGKARESQNFYDTIILRNEY